LVYVNPRLQEKELIKIYSSPDYYQSKDTDTCGYENYLEDKENITKTFKQKLKKINKFIKRGKILDMGCAFGFFLDLLQIDGWEVYGVEVSEYASKYAQTELGLNVFNGTLKNACFPDEFFDTIVMWDVVEHLSDPLAELREINRILKRDGLLVIQTPNIDSLIARFTGKRWACLQRPAEHYYYFSPKTLEIMLEKVGDKIIHSYNFEGGKFCNIRFILNRLKVYNKVIFGALSNLAEKVNLSNRSFYVDIGDNMLVLARKL